MARPSLEPAQTPTQCVTGFSHIVEQPQYDVDYSPALSAEVKNDWSHTSTSPICIHSMDRDKFTSLTM